MYRPLTQIILDAMVPRRGCREKMDADVRPTKSSVRRRKNGDYDFSISRAYYAMFYAATAVLLSEDAEAFVSRVVNTLRQKPPEPR